MKLRKGYLVPADVVRDINLGIERNQGRSPVAGINRNAVGARPENRVFAIGTIQRGASQPGVAPVALCVAGVALQNVAEELAAIPPKKLNLNAQGAFILEIGNQLLYCLHHAIRLLETPKAIPMLYPGIMRELCYWLLTGPAAEQVWMLARIANSHDQRITKAITALRSELKEPIRVVDLARSANMTAVTFHRNFKAVTGVSPLQYQKQLRLHEARRLLIFRSAKVEYAALDVGYASVSQFSREYTRLFGNSPRHDALKWKRSQAAVSSRLAQ